MSFNKNLKIKSNQLTLPFCLDKMNLLVQLTEVELTT